MKVDYMSTNTKHRKSSEPEADNFSLESPTWPAEVNDKKITTITAPEGAKRRPDGTLETVTEDTTIGDYKAKRVQQHLDDLGVAGTDSEDDYRNMLMREQDEGVYRPDHHTMKMGRKSYEPATDAERIERDKALRTAEAPKDRGHGRSKGSTDAGHFGLGTFRLNEDYEYADRRPDNTPYEDYEDYPEAYEIDPNAAPIQSPGKPPF